MEQRASNVLELKGISKSFPGVKALTDVEFNVRKGEILALVGENGAGKSTLMKILSGSYKKDTGTVIFDGREVNVSSPKEAERLGLSIIHQELNILDGITVAENIFLGRQPKKHGVVDWKQMNRQAKELFETLDIHIDVTRKVRGLSVAQKQMIEIAKAVSYDTKLVIMDEPTSSLTDQETRILFRIIRDLKRKNVAVIFISHRMDEIFEICDRATVLRDGQCIGTRDLKDTTREDLIVMMIGRELTKQYPERNVSIGDQLLRVEDLSDGKKVKHISFSVRAGEVLGFAGLVGSGRTETMRLVFGADRRASGDIYLEGARLNIRTPGDSVASHIAFVTEDRKAEGLLMRQPVKNNIVMVSLDKIKKRRVLNMKMERETARKYVNDLKIVTPTIYQKAMFLSGGNQQKVVVAKWLFSDAKVIILDEPTRGIDVGAKREIYEIINQLAGEGKAIIVVSSEMEEIMGISDRILVMHEGKIAGELQKEEFSQRTISGYAIGGGGDA